MPNQLQAIVQVDTEGFMIQAMKWDITDVNITILDMIDRNIVDFFLAHVRDFGKPPCVEKAQFGGG